jgi:hypothetical protein
MLALKQLWLERSEWQVRRSRNLTGAFAASPQGLTWARSQAICMARPGHVPEGMIEDDWLDEWHNLLPFESGYFSFADYVLVKAGAAGAAVLDYGLRWHADAEVWEETADRLDWLRTPCPPDDLTPVLAALRCSQFYDRSVALTRPWEIEKEEEPTPVPSVNQQKETRLRGGVGADQEKRPASLRPSRPVLCPPNIPRALRPKRCSRRPSPSIPPDLRWTEDG